ncbi:MAG: hypothetical protein AAF821_19515 [Cyanobacteria bacterium P01_D01_bin.156]
MVELPIKVDDRSHQIAKSCSDLGINELIVTGRGGIPTNPTNILMLNNTWADMRSDTALFQDVPPSQQLSLSPSVDNFIEASSWDTNATGQIELITNNNISQSGVNISCNSL